MRWFLFFLFLLASVTAFAQGAAVRPTHLISASTNGLGFSLSFFSFDWNKEESTVDEQSERNVELDFNYAYVFSSGLMLGTEVEYASETSELKTSTNTTNEESTSLGLGIGLGYNFNESLRDSWWIWSSTGLLKSSSETEDDTSIEENDSSAVYLRLAAGKRFGLGEVGLAQVNYSPSVQFTYLSWSGDSTETGLDSSTALVIDIVRFDVLF